MCRRSRPTPRTSREDEADRVYITAAAKNDAIIDHIIEVHATGQPILVGTHDVAESEELYERLLRRGVPAVVLNAKNDEEEARVIAEAGKLGAVTVSTQMAGRGTDIRLGGSDADDQSADHREVAELGGLHVVGTGRHRTERLDNQLRGRAAARATPGRRCSSPAGRTMWWPLTSIPASCRPNATTGRITSPKAAALLDHAQRVAEGRLLDVHANTWRYNQLIAQQRAIIVERRNTLLSTATARDELEELARALPGAGRQGVRRRAGTDLPRHHAVPTSTGAGPTTWPTSPDIRESIHLRALGRQNPLDEFHRMAVDAFGNLAADAIEAAQQTFETANVLTDEQGLDLSKLARPTSTWTYMVHDNPLNDDTMSALSLPGVFR